MLKDYEQAADELAAIVAASGVTMTAEPTTRPDWTGGEQAGHYYCALRKGPHVGHAFTYSVGSGILAQWASEYVTREPNSAGACGPMRWDRAEFKSPRYRAGHLTVYQAEKLALVRKVYRPSIADVVASLLLDTSNWEADMSFREWTRTDLAGCMEWKSPADALDTYEAIRASARFLAAAFTPEQLQAARDCASRL